MVGVRFWGNPKVLILRCPHISAADCGGVEGGAVGGTVGWDSPPSITCVSYGLTFGGIHKKHKAESNKQNWETKLRPAKRVTLGTVSRTARGLFEGLLGGLSGG